MNQIQQKIFDKFLWSNLSIAILGPAGTGKSFLISKMIEECNKTKKVFFKTAMTGTAAEIIGGQTLHSALKLGIGESSVDYYHHVICSNEENQKTFKSLDVLFIDEISMMTGTLFCKIDEVLRRVRENDEPFGGIRLVVSGDFLQLGPVFKNERSYVFESEAWKSIFTTANTFCLEELVRQQEDDEWGQMLSRIRVGKLKMSDLTKLSFRRDPSNVKKENVPRIYTHNVDVDSLNNRNLEKLIKQGKDWKEYTTEVKTKCHPAILEQYNNVLKLCVGARVIHTVNSKVNNLVNGSLGDVVGVFDDHVEVCFYNKRNIKIHFVSRETFSYHNGKKYDLVIEYIPLKLAWALTVHKSQGATFDAGVLDLSKSFTPGQVYTALSRFKTLDGIVIDGFRPDSVMVDKKSLEFYHKFGSR